MPRRSLPWKPVDILILVDEILNAEMIGTAYVCVRDLVGPYVATPWFRAGGCQWFITLSGFRNSYDCVAAAAFCTCAPFTPQKQAGVSLRERDHVHVYLPSRQDAQRGEGSIFGAIVTPVSTPRPWFQTECPRGGGSHVWPSIAALDPTSTLRHNTEYTPASPSQHHTLLLVSPTWPLRRRVPSSATRAAAQAVTRRRAQLGAAWPPERVRGTCTECTRPGRWRGAAHG